MIQKRVYIVEDMAVARATLINSLSDNNFLIAGSAASAEKAWREIKLLEIDIILLDINLTGDKDGIWLAEKIRAEHDKPIVFLTAYGDQDTLSELITLKANGYLMKPYNEPTLLTTINIALRSFEATNKIGKSDIPYIFIKNKGSHIKIDSNKIMYIKSEGNYIDIFLKHNKYTIREKLQAFIDTLPITNIKQVHQRYAINTNYIETISSHKVVINGITIPISKSYKNSITI